MLFCAFFTFLYYFYISSLFKVVMECFHMTSRRPYWCPKTMKRRPCWCPKPVLWELNSFLMQTLSFVPINLHICWPREWKHSVENYLTAICFYLYFVPLITYGKKLKRSYEKGRSYDFSKMSEPYGKIKLTSMIKNY